MAENMEFQMTEQYKFGGLVSIEEKTVTLDSKITIIVR